MFDRSPKSLFNAGRGYDMSYVKFLVPWLLVGAGVVVLAAAILLTLFNKCSAATESELMAEQGVLPGEPEWMGGFPQCPISLGVSRRDLAHPELLAGQGGARLVWPRGWDDSVVLVVVVLVSSRKRSPVWRTYWRGDFLFIMTFICHFITTN